MPKLTGNSPPPEHTEAELRRATWFKAACRTGEAKRIREAAGATLAETSRVAKVSKGLAWHYENQQKMPGLGNAARLGRIYKDMANTLKAAGIDWNAPDEKGSAPEPT